MNHDTSNMNEETANIKASFLRNIFYSTMAAGLIFAFIDYYVDPDTTRAFVTDFGLLLSAAIALSINWKTKKLELPAFIFFNSILMILTYQAAHVDGLFNPYYPITLITLSFLSPILLYRKFLITQYLLTMVSLLFMTTYHERALMNFTKALNTDSPIGFGLVYFILCSCFFVISFHLNKHYELAKERTNELARDLQEKNKEIEAQNEELRQGQEALYELNQHLEMKIEERTKKIKIQNEKLMKYAFDNGHKVRGPLARILGLFYLRTLDKNELSDMDIFSKIQHESEQMDEITKKISIELESNIHD